MGEHSDAINDALKLIPRLHDTAPIVEEGRWKILYGDRWNRGHIDDETGDHGRIQSEVRAGCTLDETVIVVAVGHGGEFHANGPEYEVL